MPSVNISLVKGQFPAWQLLGAFDSNLLILAL